MTWSFVKKKGKKKRVFSPSNTREKNSIYSSPSENNCFPVLCLNSLPKGERGAYVVQSHLMGKWRQKSPSGGEFFASRHKIQHLEHDRERSIIGLIWLKQHIQQTY
ncbi:hypothetical protein TNCV_2188881 [Trichonephila clavipes]|nr:hypothetical protein TNCV_2188881 [Trichonephila clavipes]